MALALFASSAGLVLPSAPARSAPVRMECVDSFSISKEIKAINIFDGDYAADIREAVSTVAKDCIAEKGSFSLAIPGGSVVAALGGLEADAFDFSKTHVFFCNEKIPSYPCIDGALKELPSVPAEQVYGFSKEGTPAEVADAYTAMLQSHPAVDNSGPVPSFDMMLLGTGPDGHCGCLFPDTPEIKATGAGKVVLAGNDERADGDFLAISMDVMNAAKVVLVSAAGSSRAPMVAKALSGDFGPYECPAGMVEAAGQTLWFTDTDGIAEFDEQVEPEDEPEPEPEA